MTDTKISGLAALAGTALATADEFVVVDKSDTTMAATGTDKKITTDGIFTRPSCAVSRSSTQSINDNATIVVSFDTEAYDNAGMWVIGTPTRITVPIAGTYLATAYGNISFTAGAGDEAGVGLRANGTTPEYWQSGGKSAATGTYNIAIIFKLAASGYVEMLAWQNSSGAHDLSANAYFAVQYLGTG